MRRRARFLPSGWGALVAGATVLVSMVPGTAQATARAAGAAARHAATAAGPRVPVIVFLRPQPQQAIARAMAPYLSDAAQAGAPPRYPHPPPLAIAPPLAPPASGLPSPHPPRPPRLPHPPPH